MTKKQNASKKNTQEQRRKNLERVCAEMEKDYGSLSSLPTEKELAAREHLRQILNNYIEQLH